MLSTLEGELPRTRGPNPLFWTHTLAHLSLTPNHLQLTLSLHPFPAPRIPLSYLLPPFLPSTALRLLPQRQTRHIARSVALLPRQAFPRLPAEVPSALTNRPPRSILYNYPACITKVAAKLFPPPRETAPFNPLLANSESVRLTLFLSSRAPFARTRLIGVVFRSVVLAISALMRVGVPIPQECVPFRIEHRDHRALLLTPQYT